MHHEIENMRKKGTESALKTAAGKRRRQFDKNLGP
jgi:hypothetical protein